MPGKFEVNGCKISEKAWFVMMASSSALSTARKQQTSQESNEVSDANVARSTSFDFARQQFFKNRKVIIRNVPRVTYDVRTNELIV